MKNENVGRVRLRLHSVPDSFPRDVKKHLSVPFRNAIFRGIVATERCCFSQLLKVVQYVSGRCFFAPLWKAIRYSAWKWLKAWFPYGRKNRVTIFRNGQFIIIYTCKPHIYHKYSSVVITYFQLLRVTCLIQHGENTFVTLIPLGTANCCTPLTLV